jgi:hypothetical protein
MHAHSPRQGTRAPVAARQRDPRRCRLAGVLAAVACGLLASAAIGPAAALAVTKPAQTGGSGTAGVPPASQSTVHVITAGGMAGWQIALIALGAALLAAAATLLLTRVIARRAAPATTA